MGAVCAHVRDHGEHGGPQGWCHAALRRDATSTRGVREVSVVPLRQTGNLHVVPREEIWLAALPPPCDMERLQSARRIRIKNLALFQEAKMSALTIIGSMRVRMSRWRISYFTTVVEGYGFR